MKILSHRYPLLISHLFLQDRLAGLFVKNPEFNEYRFMIGWIDTVNIVINLLVVENFNLSFV